MGCPRDQEYKEKAAQLQAGYDREAKALAAQLRAEIEAENRVLAEKLKPDLMRLQRIPDHTGFSLDPTYDHESLRKWFKDEAKPLLLKLAAGEDSLLTAQSVAEVERALEKDDVVPLLGVVGKLKKSSNFGAQLTAELLKEEQGQHRYQKARYDGDLQGTEVGMVLFYTDLLAKLWALDYQNTLPRREVEDFRADTDGGNPKLYEAETRKYPGTRLWFGPEERAYQLVRDDARGWSGVLFARRATRIFSASSNDLEPGKEVPTNYAADRVMSWWNDHYEEVAAYEAEYERLNQYIKWSVIISWLDSRKELDQLAFLSGVKVDHDAWFPDWVNKHSELRYQKWAKVGFHEKGFKRETTEAMPILASASFADYGSAAKQWVVSGGVSGAKPRDLEIRPVLSEKLIDKPAFSLHGVDLKTLDPTGKSLTTLGGTRHNFQETSPQKAAMTAEPAEQQALRSTNGDMARTKFERTVTAPKANEVVLKTRAASAELGELSIERGENGFKVNHLSRQLDTAQSVARKASPNRKPLAEVLAQDARCECVIDHGDGTVTAKLQDGTYYRFAVETKGSPEIGSGWDSRVGGTEPGSKTLLVARVEPREVLRLLADSEYLSLDLQPVLDKRSSIPVLARGPPADRLPPKLRDAVLGDGSHEIASKFDPDTNRLYIRKGDLSDALRQSPDRLVRMARGSDPTTVKADLARPDGLVRLGGSGGSDGGGKPPLIAHLEAGNRTEAGKLIARDPTEARKILETDRRDRCDRANRLLDQGFPAEAKLVLEQGLKVHPEHSELLVRLGTVEAVLGRPELGARTLSRAADRARGPEVLNREINRRLANAKPAEREALLREARLAAARDLKKSKKTTAEAKLTAENGRVELEVRLSDDLKGERAQPGDLKPGDLLFLDDSAALSNRDFSPAAREKTMDQLPIGDSYELLRVTEPDKVLQTKPDRVHAGSGNRAWSYRLAHGLTNRPVLVRYQKKDDEDDYEEIEVEGPDGPVKVKVKRDRNSHRVFVLRKKARS